MRRTVVNLALVSVAMMVGVLPSFGSHMAVVVDKGNPTADVSSSDLTKLLQNNTKAWPTGKKVVVVLRDLPSADTELALRRLLNLSPGEIKDFMTAHKGSIVTANSDESLLKIVETTPGAVGLVDVYSITNRVNVVKVDGKLPLEQGYLLR